MRAHHKWSLVVFLAVVMIGGLRISSPGAQRRILLDVACGQTVWGESRLLESLVWQLSQSPELRITVPANSVDGAPAFPAARYDPDSLIDWGREVGGQYLLVVEVLSEHITRKKAITIPLILHRWKTIGQIEVTVRLVDLGRGRLLMNEKLVETVTGRSVFQGDADNSSADPDLHMTAPDQRVLIDRLEERLAGRIYARVKKLIWVR